MVSTSNKRSLRIRTGPHDHGPREWCVFFFFHGGHVTRDAMCIGSRGERGSRAQSHTYSRIHSTGH